MENNISKKFYLFCKADGITILNSKADVARIGGSAFAKTPALKTI